MYNIKMLGINLFIIGIAIFINVFLIVKDRGNFKKNKDINKGIAMNLKDKKIALLIVLCTMFLYYVVGYFLKTDNLNAITLRTNGISFSFIGIILLIVTSVLIGNIINIIRKNNH